MLTKHFLRYETDKTDGSCLPIHDFLFTAFQQEAEDEQPTLDEVSAETLAKIESAGFNADHVVSYDGKLFIEGDIVLTYAQLDQMAPENGVPNSEHYSTTNLVTGTPRTISVYVNMPTLYRNATDIAIARYNSENLNLTMKVTVVLAQFIYQVNLLAHLPTRGCWLVAALKETDHSPQLTKLLWVHCIKKTFSNQHLPKYTKRHVKTCLFCLNKPELHNKSTLCNQK